MMNKGIRQEGFFFCPKFLITPSKVLKENSTQKYLQFSGFDLKQVYFDGGIIAKGFFKQI